MTDSCNLLTGNAKESYNSLKTNAKESYNSVVTLLNQTIANDSCGENAFRYCTIGCGIGCGLILITCLSDVIINYIVKKNRVSRFLKWCQNIGFGVMIMSVCGFIFLQLRYYRT